MSEPVINWSWWESPQFSTGTPLSSRRSRGITEGAPAFMQGRIASALRNGGAFNHAL